MFPRGPRYFTLVDLYDMVEAGWLVTKYSHFSKLYGALLIFSAVSGLEAMLLLPSRRRGELCVFPTVGCVSHPCDMNMTAFTTATMYSGMQCSRVFVEESTSYVSCVIIDACTYLHINTCTSLFALCPSCA